MREAGILLCILCAFVDVGRVLPGRAPRIAGIDGCGISGLQYVVREGEDILSGALVSRTCGSSTCSGKEVYATGVLWERKYHFLRTGLPSGVHLVKSCENAEQQDVHVGNNAAEAAWYGVAVG